MKKICKICGKEFEARANNVVVCKDSTCRKEYNKQKYLLNLKPCICSKCKISYLATQKQSHTLCPNCVNVPYTFKHTYEQQHCCRQCGAIVYTEVKNVTQTPQIILYDITCDACKEENKKQNSIRMTINNANPLSQTYDTLDEALVAKEHRQEAKQKYKTQEERSLAFSNRMKLNNPMKNPEVAKKVSATLKAKYLAGEITIDGTKRSNYKGTRGINQYLRMALHSWVKENLERANYTCEKCGAKGVYLMVHHLEKFADIVAYFAKQLNLDLKTLKYKSEDYNKLEALIIDYHKTNNIGIVLCESCHDIIDKCFHKRKLKEEIDDENS